MEIVNSGMIHCFEQKGLGKAPFKFVMISEQNGSHCDYCGTAIRYEYWIDSVDGQRHKVGCECIKRTGDEGLISQYKNSAAHKELQKKIRKQREIVKYQPQMNQLTKLIAENKTILESFAHPFGNINWETKQPRNYLDFIDWFIEKHGVKSAEQMIAGVTRRLIEYKEKHQEQQEAEQNSQITHLV